MDAVSFRIGSSNREHVIVTPTRRENPDATDDSDGNWVYCDIAVAAGAFRGRFEAQLRSEELAGFRAEISALTADPRGHAKLEPMEPWVTIAIAGDGRGHFCATCVAVDMLGSGNSLSFRIDFDQTELAGILRGLDAVVAAFPVVGAP